ncbi:YqhR family membrane protein [Jeotgalibacillus aurantiacus]|uniref:YqhR family membrane protein n=1 Tax=Jeotgalibacillus aurantiacus TaxID=2763266 RepID=UPI001D0B444C|nr:YqhR family membrane protein [Jeotgalibacillus aurantiacus]
MKFPTMSFNMLTFWTGLTAGVLFYLMNRFYTFFHFIENEWLLSVFPDWEKNWLNQLQLLFIVCLISIVWAFLYKSFIKTGESIIPGVIVNLILLLLIFAGGWLADAAMNPLKLEAHTVISMTSLFILHGAFTGYSIAYHEPYEQDSETSGAL